MIARRSPAGAALMLLGWAVIGMLWIVTVVRVVAWDKWEVFAVLDALMLLLYLPAWLIAVLAVWRRRFVLAVAAVAMVVAQVVFVSPELTAAQALPRHLGAATVIRIFDANVDQDNPSLAGYARAISRDRPDVVTLEEASFADLHQLVASGALTDLPYRFWNEAGSSRSIFIASRYPLGTPVKATVDGQPYLVRTVVAAPRHPVALWVVHTTAPVDPGVGAWNDELDGVRRLLRADHPRPVVVVGDFNATWTNRGFHDILATGLVDAAAARGEALDMTWSQLTSPLPPLLRIDHLLTGPGVVATAIHTEDGPGSDHRALVATVAVVPR